MCQAWRESYQVFSYWANSNGYKDKLQCDRIQNNIGYCPSNCRWVTAERNCANRKRAVILPTGETTAQVAKRLGVSTKAILYRLKNMPLTPMQVAMMKKLIGGQIKRLFYLKKIGKWVD